MKILFVLPRYTKSTIGGHKIIYEYANRMCEKGYDISILFINDWVLPEYNIPLFIKNIYANIQTIFEPHWFNLNKKIRKISAKSKNYINKIKNCDVVIYTACQTVGFVDGILKRAKKMYFIQGYEDFLMPEKELIKTYKKGYTNIVISKWLKNIVDSHSGQDSILISNPIDTNTYKEKTSIKERKKYSVSFMYHQSMDKGTKYTIEVIKKLAKNNKELEVYAFGVYRLNEKIPGLVKYYQNASPLQVVEIYNSASVFMNSSIKEGFGLTGLEAMSCGTVLVSSEFETVHEYAKDKENALLSPVKDVEAMYNNVVTLFENDELRYELSKKGIKTAKNFDWDIAINKFEEIIK